MPRSGRFRDTNHHHVLPNNSIHSTMVSFPCNYASLSMNQMSNLINWRKTLSMMRFIDKLWRRRSPVLWPLTKNLQILFDARIQIIISAFIWPMKLDLVSCSCAHSVQSKAWCNKHLKASDDPCMDLQVQLYSSVIFIQSFWVTQMDHWSYSLKSTDSSTLESQFWLLARCK